MKKSRKAAFFLALLDILIAAAFIITVVLVIRGQVDGNRTAEELGEAAKSAMSNAFQARAAEGWELKKYYGIAEEDVGEYFLMLPVSNMDAAELCVIKCRDADSAKDTASLMKKRLDGQISLFENYGVEQMKLLRAARVFSVGPYAALIIDETADDAAAAVLHLTGGRKTEE